MSGQTTYDDTPAIGFQGMLGEPFSLSQVDSGIVETAAMPLGIAVKPGSATGLFVACVATDAVYGVSVFAHSPQENQTGDFAYDVESQFPVLSKGRYWAIADGAIAIGADVAQVIASEKVSTTVGASSTLAFAKAVSASAADGDLIMVEVYF